MNTDSLPYYLYSVIMALAVGLLARKPAQTRMPHAHLLPLLILTFVFAGFGFTLFAPVAVESA